MFSVALAHWRKLTPTPYPVADYSTVQYWLPLHSTVNHLLLLSFILLLLQKFRENTGTHLHDFFTLLWYRTHTLIVHIHSNIPYKHCLKCQNWASSGPLRVAADQSWPGSGTHCNVYGVHTTALAKNLHCTCSRLCFIFAKWSWFARCSNFTLSVYIIFNTSGCYYN